MKYYSIIAFVLIYLSVNSQTLKGEVLDSLTRQELPYVNLGIKGKRIGVYSNENGKYNFDLSKTSQEDTLIVSLIGYRKQKIALSRFFEKKEYQFNFQLIPKIESLNEIFILSKPKKYSTNKIQISTGNRNQTFPSSVPYGSEIAVFIENSKHKKGKLSQLHLKFKSIKDDKFKTHPTYYRLAFYNLDTLGFPGDLVHFENVIIKPKIKTKSFKIDLEDKEIPFSEDGIFVGIETIKPDFVKQTNSMYLTTPNLLYTHTKTSLKYYRFHSNVWHKQKRKSILKKKLFTVPFIKVKVAYEAE
tara:strand:- start:6596 stop:7498 length:903 start_codon:yes stop_codon:yes gene_type:complete